MAFRLYVYHLFSWRPFPKLAGPLLKDKTNPSEFVPSFGQAHTTLCAGCWQCSAACFRQPPQGVETQGKRELPPMWCSEMEFFFFFFLFSPILKQSGIRATFRPGLLGLDDLFIRWLWYVYFPTGVFCRGKWRYEETRGPCDPPPLNPHPEVNNDNSPALRPKPGA